MLIGRIHEQLLLEVFQATMPLLLIIAFQHIYHPCKCALKAQVTLIVLQLADARIKIFFFLFLLILLFFFLLLLILNLNLFVLLQGSSRKKWTNN